MLNQDTKRKIDSARQILVGKVPDPKAQVEQITTALIYKFMDDMDKEAEEMKGKARFFTNGYEKYAWTKLMDAKLGGHDRLDLYIEAITSLSQNPHIPQLFRDIFKDTFLPYRNPETLSLFLKEINGFTYDNSEDLGDAFEYLLSILGSQGDAGQFRTPRHIIDFIVAVVNPKKDETICDPACGTAGFLISAYKHILKQHDGLDDPENKEKPLTPDERKTLMDHFAGYDISPDMVRLSKVNLYLHGFPSPTIFEYDTLSSEEKWDESFDVMLANPPFMSPKGGIRPHKRFSVQANRSEVLFVDYILEHLQPKGRAGIIVPEGIIFQSATAYKALRKMLVEDGLLAVVSLPAGVFNPYSGVKTSILIFDNELAKKVNHILFIKIANDGFDLGAQRRFAPNKNDLPKALELIKAYKKTIETGGDYAMIPQLKYLLDDTQNEENRLATLVEKQDIAKTGDYNLSGDRYKKVINFANQKWPMLELGDLEKEEKIYFLRGQGISKKDIVENGKNKCIHYGEIYTIYQPAIKNVISKTNLEGRILSKKGDVLVPSTTTADAMGIAVARALNKDGVILGGDINIIRTENKYILAIYLAYLISNSSVKNQLATFAKGVNILHLSNSDLRKLKIPLPPLEVQKEIVEQIEVKQNAIEGAKVVIENLERERRYFGRSLRKLGGIEWVELEKICEITSSKRIYQNEYVDKGIPFYRSKEIIELSKNMKISTSLYISEKKFDELKKKFGAPQKGDLLITAVGSIGFTYVVPNIKDFYFKDGNLLWLRNLSPKLDTYYLRGILGYMLLRNVKSLTNGGAYNALTIEKLRKFEIPLPSLEIQKQFVAEMEEQEKIIEANKKLIGIMEQKIKGVLEEI